MYGERLSERSRVELIDLVAVPTDQSDSELRGYLARVTRTYNDRRGAAAR